MFMALALCQFKRGNCTDPHQSVEETTGELAKVYAIGREGRVSEQQEANAKGFPLASSGVRASKALCPRSYSALLPASFPKGTNPVTSASALNCLGSHCPRLKFKLVSMVGKNRSPFSS